MDEKSRVAAEQTPASPPSTPEGNSASPSRSTGSSSGGRPLILESDQKTVISKTPPLEVHLHSRVSVHEMGKLLVGERLGHFVLEEFVGGGGMGAVFRATDTELGRTVAVKVVSGAHNDEETLRRFKNEAQSTARLDHQNIARVYYVGEDKGWHYIVFEFIHGVNVRDLVQQKGPLPLEEALHYTLQVAEALEHAAKRDVVHRDIKPSNVLVMQNGTVKVVDMGLARLHQVESTANDLTASGVTLGTFDYISPEQARDPRSTDVRSDLYSLGCTLYFMLTGRPPFPLGTVLQKLLSHSSEPPPDPRDLRSDLGEEVTEIIHRLLAKNPNDRFQSPGELIDRLLLLADELGLKLAGHRGGLLVTRTEEPLSRLEKILPWAVPIAVLIVVVLVIEIFAPAQQIAVSRPQLPPALDTLTTRNTSTADVRESDAQSEESSATAASTLSQRSAAANTAETTATGSSSQSPQAASANVPQPDNDQPANSDDLENDSIASGGDAGDENVDSAGSATPESEGSDISSNVTSADPAVPIERIIVSEDSTQVPNDAIRVANLEAAVVKAKDLPHVDIIEIHVDGELLCEPLVVSAKDKVEFRAGYGFDPVLVFQPTLDSLGVDRHMIEITGGNSAWNGIHFRFDLPPQLSSGWSLFALNEVESAEFKNCTFTIRNAGINGSMLHEQVAFFEMLQTEVNSRMGMGMGMGNGDMTMPMNSNTRTALAPVLNLENCAARGQATFVRAKTAHPFSFNWRQGLLGTNDRLFELEGAGEEQQNWDAVIEFQLESVTAALDKGLGLMDLSSKRHLLGLVIELNNCVLLTNVEAPLIEHQGVSDLDSVLNLGLRYRGQGNFYPPRLPSMTTDVPQRVHWRITSTDGTVHEFKFNERIHESGYEEDIAKEYVAWADSVSPPTIDLRYDRHHKSQYRIDNVRGNPVREAGFHYDTLPDFPDQFLAPLREQ